MTPLMTTLIRKKEIRESRLNAFYGTRTSPAHNIFLIAPAHRSPFRGHADKYAKGLYPLLHFLYNVTICERKRGMLYGDWICI